MSDTIKIIAEVDREYYQIIKRDVENHLTDFYPFEILGNGIPLDSNSEKAEVQAYFAGQTYGWEEGRKALIDDIKVEIEKMPTDYCGGYIGLDKQEVLQILDNMGKATSGE